MHYVIQELMYTEQQEAKVKFLLDSGVKLQAPGLKVVTHFDTFQVVVTVMVMVMVMVVMVMVVVMIVIMMVKLMLMMVMVMAMSRTGRKLQKN